MKALKGLRAPKPDGFIVEDMGARGIVQNERELAYYEVVPSEHIVLRFSPWMRFSISNSLSYITWRMRLITFRSESLGYLVVVLD